MAIINNKIIVDLSKVQWTLFGYRNQYGIWSDTAHKYSVRGEPYNPADAAFGSPYTMEELAINKGLKDSWLPEFKMKLTANEWLIYTGTKAVEMDKAWRAKIFGKKKSKK